MAEKTGIEWTNATWNPLVGCSKVSEECRFCYAMTMAARIANAAQAALREGRKITDVQEAYRKVVKWKEGGKLPASDWDVALPTWNNEVSLIESVLNLPLRWKAPKMVFVNSMSDLFHPSVPFGFVDKVFAVMALTPQHTYQILTKRPDRMAEYLTEGMFELYSPDSVIEMICEKVEAAGKCIDGLCQPGYEAKALYSYAVGDTGEYSTAINFPLRNVWLGASVGNRSAANERRDHLKKVADIGFLTWVSNEPSLGPVDWTGWEFLRWMVSGGESGHEARPSHVDWHRQTRDWCQRNGIPFFFKQWGEWLPGHHYTDDLRTIDPALESSRFECAEHDEEGFSTGYMMAQDVTDPDALYKVGKKRAGRLLDGRTWDEFPEVARG